MWELHDGQQQAPSHDEAHVLRMIAAGLPPSTLVRRAGTEEWKGLRTHAPFAMALDQRGARPAATTTAAQGHATNPYTLAGACIMAGAVFLAVVVGLARSNSTTPPPAKEPPRVAAPAPPEAKPPTLAEVLVTKKTAPEAFAVARPLMVDQPNDTSPGGALFAVWSVEHLRWPDVAVTRDETTVARVLKDVDAERGKRLCVGGAVIEIAAVKQPQGTLFTGLLLSVDGELHHFLAVKSTGDLVEHSTGRFCGFVVGRYDYANSAGGAGHAIDMVGMFDLPANRK